MSLVIETFIICDVCGDSFGVDSRNNTGTKQRTTAKSNGWIYSGNKDYCPNCRAKNKDGKIRKSKTQSINTGMKKIFLKQYNALFDYPIVDKPDQRDYNFGFGHNMADQYKRDLLAYNKWLQSKIEIVGEHSFEDNQVVVEGVDYKLQERWKPLNPKDADRIYEVIYVAIPINILNRV